MFGVRDLELSGTDTKHVYFVFHVKTKKFNCYTARIYSQSWQLYEQRTDPTSLIPVPMQIRRYMAYLDV